MEQPPGEHSVRWKWAVAAAVTLVAAWWAFRWTYPSYQPPVLPVPNAYDSLVQLADDLAGRTEFWTNMQDNELTAIVLTNRPVLEQVREELSKPCVVPLDWNADQFWLSTHTPRSERLRLLARAFAAEGRRAQTQGDTRHAVTCGLDAMHLMRAASRGGLGTDYLMALGINYGAAHWLRDACETATLDDCRYLLGNLPDIEIEMELPAEITEREWHFWRRINGSWETFQMEMTFANNRTDFELRMQEGLLMARTLNELVRLHYAIRAFQLTQSRLPASLGELSGGMLASLPRDPFSSGDFVYVPGKNRYLLYSVGPNGVDDGGIESSRDPSQGDILLQPSHEAAHQVARN